MIFTAAAAERLEIGEWLAHKTSQSARENHCASSHGVGASSAERGVSTENGVADWVIVS